MKTRILLIVYAFVILAASSFFISNSDALRVIWGLEQMIERSDVVAVGTVESTWVDIRPFEEYIVIDTAKIKVDKWFKNKNNLDSLEIRYYGYWAKTIDDLRGRFIFDKPVHSYIAGQKVLVIATYEKPTMVMGEGYYPFYEGKFLISGNNVTDTGGKQMILNALYDTIQNHTQKLPPCTSDRTACFNQNAGLCDPTGWECRDAKGIFEEIIENEN